MAINTLEPENQNKVTSRIETDVDSENILTIVRWEGNWEDG